MELQALAKKQLNLEFFLRLETKFFLAHYLQLKPLFFKGDCSNDQNG